MHPEPIDALSVPFQSTLMNTLIKFTKNLYKWVTWDDKNPGPKVHRSTYVPVKY